VSENANDARRRLPSVTSLLESGGVQALLEQTPRAVVVDAIRRVYDTAARHGGRVRAAAAPV